MNNARFVQRFGVQFKRLNSILAICLLSAGVASAQTVVQGNIGGTWGPSGNPYIAVANCTLTNNLILQPGVVFDIETNVTITASSYVIQAAGTPTQRITIQGWPSTTNYFNMIYLVNGTGTNRFKYCDFANAQAAISMLVDGNYYVIPIEIINCTFSNCVSEAFFGEGYGDFTCCGAGGEPNAGTGTINPLIENCVFSGMSNGCVMYIAGKGSAGCGCGGNQYGYANPIILNNVFQNLTGTAFLMENGGNPGGGSPIFQNNTIVNCGSGVIATDPWNATVQDNIFQGVANAVIVSGSLSRTISYNDFFGNATNFTGLPAAYGQQLLFNRNETSSDVFYNIFQNPLFVSTNNFQLQTNSTCIGAGAAGGAYENLCSPPSSGSAFGDMGAYGGPDACNWLTTVPLLPTAVSAIESNNLLWLNWEAIPRSTYQVLYVATNLDASSGTNKWLTNTIVTPAATPTAISVAPYPPTNHTTFYKIQSLGRTPGN